MRRGLAIVLKGLSALALALFLAACVQHLRHSGDDELPARSPAHLRVATLNVHYILLGKETGAWSLADWDRRKGPLEAAVRTLDADLIAFQEMESFQRGSDGSVNLARDWLAARNPDYAVAAAGPWR